jgi:large subunit ribosomal protein L15
MSMVHQITTGLGNKLPRRKGRGESSGRGKTCGRGNKGSKARVGRPYWKPGHEGGQTPIHRRLPKRGFSNDQFERRFHIVNIADLNRFEDGQNVDAAALIEAGLVPDERWPVKILGDGRLWRKLTIQAGAYSRSAFEQIARTGGSAQNLQGQAFAFPKHKRRFATGPAAGKSGGRKASGKKAEAPGDEPAKAPAAASEPTEQTPGA